MTFGLDDMTLVELDTMTINVLDVLPLALGLDKLSLEVFDFGLGL